MLPFVQARLKLRASLMASASVLTAASTPAAAAQFRSINQALSQRGIAGSAVAASAVPSAGAARQAATGVANLKTAAARFLSLTQQLAGDTAAAITPGVPDGLTAGGLQPAAGYRTAGNANAWRGVSATQPVVQTGATGAITVTINQTAPRAVLNWQTFNVGRHTHVNFNQSAGKAAAPTWTVLNRVQDPLASPTRILGEITAQGQVLVLNQNGVLFEAGSQVNLHSLVAGAVSISNQQYLNSGLYSAGGVPSFIGGAGSVSVAPGADILTSLAPSVTTGGGSVILLGANASNGGFISTPGGQTILAAGQSFTLQPGYNVTQTSSGATTGNLYATVLGTEIAAKGRGTAVNTGIIQSTDGDITLDAQTVQQYGVLVSSTSVHQRGTIHLLNNLTDTSHGTTAVNTGGSITLEPGSVTEILPDSSAATALNAAQQAGDTPVQAYSKQTLILPDEAENLPDRQGLSRVEITTGGTVTFAAGSVTLAPGGQIVTDATGRIFAANGAQLDVSGLTGVTAPITENLLAISTEPFNLSESPLNNSASGVLNSATLYVDAQELTEVAGTAADPATRDYTAGGLLQVAGELANVGHTASEWSTVAGQIMLYAAQVIAQQGAVFNIAGGSETFTGGQVRQSYVQASDGTVYNVNTAPNDLTYTSVYTGEHVVHARWHITDTYENGLLTPEYVLAPGYTIGRNAGSLILSTPTAVFAGTINGGASQGITQTQAPVSATDPFLLAQDVAPLAGTLALGNFTPNTASSATQIEVFPTRVVINAAGSTANAGALSASKPLPRPLEDTAVFSASQLDGLGGVSITVGDAPRAMPASITVAAPVVLAPGGQVSLTAPAVTARASITAEAGSITLQTSSTGTNAAQDKVVLASGARLDTAGGFTNVFVDPADAAAVAFQNGGDVTLESYGALALQAGSRIDTSSGAVFANSFSGGKGGSVTIVADDPTSISPYTLGRVQVDADIASYGVTGSGTLSITVPSVTISDSPRSRAPNQVAFAPGLFTRGFTDYVIDGFAVPTYSSTAAGVTVEPGTRIVADVPVLVEGSQTPSLPTGGPAGGGLQLYLPPEYLFNGLARSVTQRAGASVTLTSGSAPLLNGGGNPPGAAVTLDSGASITVDQGQSVTLSSVGQVSVLGTITAHAGTISLLNLANLDTYLNADTVSKLSVWVGGAGVLDASAVAETARDLQGLPYGVVPAGGSIILGSPGDFADYGNGGYGNADPAFLFVRPGAVLNAAGASAAITEGDSTSSVTAKTVEASATRIVQDASSGGTLTFVSGDGIYLDGSFTAAAGAAFAQGGTLRVELDTPQYAVQTATTADPAWTIDPHEIVLSDLTRSTALPANLAPGQNGFLLTPDVAGKAALSQQQITAGGFTNVDLFARDQIAFAGNVSLSAAQSIRLVAFGLTETSLHGAVAITAPYVQLAGAPSVGQVGEPGYEITPLVNQTGARPGSAKYAPCLAGPGDCAGATLTVSGDLIDIENDVGFGVHAVVTDSSVPFGGASITRTIDSAGFDLVQLDSAGDIRFAANNEGTNTGLGRGAKNQKTGLPEQAAFLETSGDLALSAGEIYPQTGVTGTLAAGQVFGGGQYKESTLDISVAEGAQAALPLSAFGSLTLIAATIDQGGNLAAPLGNIAFNATRVVLLPGSTTSVSAAGLDIPFGGTTDGVSYDYAGQTLTFQPAGYGVAPSDAALSPNANHGIVFDAVSVDGERGSLLDLSGGGTLAGGGGEIVSNGAFLSQGFIAGSGGSTDALYSTIITFSPATHGYAQSLAAGSPGIYAILPGLAASYAPGTLLDAQTDYAGSVPQTGEQISIGASVPGLAAGTYTLLPSYYALLPGAYRVQLGQGGIASAPQTESFDGISTATTGTIGFANTALRNALPTEIIVTSAAAVQRYSQYDQEGLAAVATSQAAVFDTPRPNLPQDAGTIEFQFTLPAAAKNVAPPAVAALTFDGTADLQAAAGGYGGLVAVEAPGAPIVITDGARPLAGDVSVAAQSLDALGAPLLEIGGFFRAAPNNVSVEYSEGISQDVTVAQGATLTAGAAWLFAAGQISVDAGATISTLGRPVTLPDSATGLVFVGGTEGADGTLGAAQAIAELGVANGTYVFSPASAAGGAGRVTIGAASGHGAPVSLYSDGFVGISGGDGVTIASNTRLGAATFAVAVPEIDLGTPAPGQRSAGFFTLTQATLDALLAGAASVGAPSATSLSLTATDSLNLFGAVSLDGDVTGTQAGISILLDTPAIYGYGRAGQTATIEAPDFIWSGTTNAAGPVLAGGAGDGTLKIEAQQITLGQPAASQQQAAILSRTILGFAAVDLSASDFISANGKSSLAVYQKQGAQKQGAQKQGAGQPDGSASFTGGTLTLTTPLLTTQPGAILSLTAGGPVSLAPAVPGLEGAAPSGLGGEIDIAASAITLAGTVSLPGGALSLDATGNITLGAGSAIDLGGRPVGFFDITQDSFGGTLRAQSAKGDVAQDAGAVINLAAAANFAGTADFTAASGTVSLAGSILGSADAGYASGNITVQAGSIANLTALNQALDAGGVFQSRSFEQTGAGDLAIGSELVAHQISVSADQGSLTVTGTLNASGAAPGTISLAAAQGLTLAAGAVLDVHGTTLQTDSTGAAIDSENTGRINLTVSAGTLTIAPGASFDLASPDGQARGDIEINIPRTTATSGDAEIAAAGPISISGAGTIAVNAFWTYTPDSSSALAGGIITQASLAAFDRDSQAFIANALSGGLVHGQLAGLSAYTSAFHLRPGVQIESSADANGGTLAVQGDLDLAGLRYTSVNPETQLTPAIAGSGEPGVLWIRAGADLDVFGSITDGFAAPPATPDDDGWVLKSGTADTFQNLVLTQKVTLAGAGGPNGATTYPVGDYTLSYPVTIANGATLAAGARLPGAAVLTNAVTIPAAFVLNGQLTLAGGGTLRPGQTVAAGTVLPAGTLLAAGTILPVNVRIGGTGTATGYVVAAGVNFDIFADARETIAATLELQAGSVIPAGAAIQFTAAGETSIATRPTGTVDGEQVQGQIWGIAPLLPAGDLSWSLALVSGANLAAADGLAVLPQAAGGAAAATSTGNLVLSDPHYAEQKTKNKVLVGTNVDFSVLRTGTGTLSLVSGGDITEASLFGVYTAGTQSADVGTAYDQPRPLTGGTVLGRAGNLAGANGATYNAAVQAYQANYPTGGGDLTLQAQGNIVGDTYQPPAGFFSGANGNVSLESSATSSWLWWQGSAATPASWWINFGTYLQGGSPHTVYLTGFTGFGTLGGGNVTVSAGGDAGAIATSTAAQVSQGLDVVVASTGRVAPGGATLLTGGGTVDISARAINPAAPGGASDDFNGTFSDLRGNIAVQAGSIGGVTQFYSTPSGNLDPRLVSPFVSETFASDGGPVLVLGDGGARLTSRGDEVLSGVGDPTLGVQDELAQSATATTTQFSLWQSTTSVTLQALSGTTVPVSSNPAAVNETLPAEISQPNVAITKTTLYPPTLDVTNFTGDVKLELLGTGGVAGLELAPAPNGTLQVLAGNSIIDSVTPLNSAGLNFAQATIDVSGAPSAAGDIPTPADPANSGQGFFSFETDTASGLLHQGDTVPSRFYAVSGDIIGLLTGQTYTATNKTTKQTELATIAATALDIRAGRDVVGLKALALNNNAGDISTIQAGRDVVYATEQVAGPGELQVQAGRNVYEADIGSLVSLGEIGAALTQATRDDGAAVTVLAGVGADGPNLAGFANLYLDPANLANAAAPLQSQPGRVERTYQDQLLAFLQTRFAYTGSASGALAAFLTLPQDQQTSFLLGVYFAELNQSGLDYNTPSSRFYHSYLEGKEAISTLFPATDPTGTAPPSGGSLTLFSGTAGDGSIRTLFGGGITTVVPFGQTSLGNFGFVPGASAGVITEGGGDIDMYSYGSVSLGQSRILTTFGGNILIWLSSDGEINAGRGSKSTVLTAPIGISYDAYANVTLSPTVPSSGAGIGTISPIPQVAPGDVNLIAPVGTIDAGEAGIRASGNANLAALTLLNANNIQVTGKTAGVPTVTAPSAAAQAAASSSAGASAAASQQVASRSPAENASVIEVDVLSVTDVGGDDPDERRRRARGGVK